MRRFIALAGLGTVLFSAGCESTAIAPHHGASSPLEPDERRIWARSREEQARFDQSDFHVRLPEVEDYLDGLVARLQPEPLPDRARFRVRVLVDPSVNAFAMPDGAVYIHTGLMARVENEAQLATVLAHEITHTVNRHVLKGTRQLKNQTAFLATIGAGTVGAGLTGSVVQLLGTISTVAAVSGYSRDLEREADTEGFRKLIAAGYDAHESTKVFRLMLAESDRLKTKAAPFFFSTHPRVQERIASYEQLIAAQAAPIGGQVGEKEYAAILPPVLAYNAEATLRRGDFDGAEKDASRYLALRPGEPHLTYVLAEAHRKRGGPGDAATATRILQELIAAHADFPEAYRSLGLAQMKENARAEAARNFHRYLELKPDAADRGYIQEFIRQCES